MSEIPVISIGETRVTLFALLAGLFFLAAAAAVTVRLRRREWKTGPAVLFCLAATIYAFMEKGPLYGGLGIILTILVYIFSSKAK